MNILFITWDGPNTNYLQGLFLPIFKKLGDRGIRVHIVQFTWADADRVSQLIAACKEAEIPYRSAPIWRKAGGAGAFASAVVGNIHIRRAVRDWHIDTLMPRSLMPALSVLSMSSLKGLKLAFDADGFSADERVDFAGLSPKSVTYRVLRAIEARTTRLADRVLVRTPSAIDILIKRSGSERGKFHVVGNGRDGALYAKGWPERNDGEFRLCYVGSLGVQYLPDQMIAIAQILRSKMSNVVLRVFTGDHSELDHALNKAAVGDKGWLQVSRIMPEEVPHALMQCDLALALRQPAFSTQGVAPIKLGEYLLAGLPIIGTANVGPVDPIIDAKLFLPVQDDLSKVWPWVRDAVIPNQKNNRIKAQALGQQYFSLQGSVDSYLAALL